MKKTIFIGLGVLFLVSTAIWLGMYFYGKANQAPEVFKTESPFVASITKKTVATGSIVPRREVLVKPQASGIIEAIYVQAGEVVKAGQLLAKVRVVANLAGINNDMQTINNSNNQVETARINFQNAQIELDRQKKLLDQKMISQQEYNRFLLDFNVRKEAVSAAEKGFALTKERVLQNSGKIANDIYSTVDGMILDIPVKVGGSVVERNNFNEGTTIAAIADMKTLIFEGKIDESEVGKLKEGMDLNLTIGAIEGRTFKAKLEYIAPKGITEEGAIKFLIKAEILLDEKDFVRAGYSANADIVLDKKDSVLSIKESMLQFGGEKKDSVFVEVEVTEQKFEKRLVKTGISDGINVEVLSGVVKTDKIKTPEPKKDEKDKKPEEKKG
ncbi:MAG: efflux RND transporter periplasmic adaptor subunit [Bacteroidetes bacterium]|nr:MAG: efflux RND transporter periplasmic adaptor subunit [Bacteroidota bacterium]